MAAATVLAAAAATVVFGGVQAVLGEVKQADARAELQQIGFHAGTKGRDMTKAERKRAGQLNKEMASGRRQAEQGWVTVGVGVLGGTAAGVTIGASVARQVYQSAGARERAARVLDVADRRAP